MIQQQTPADYLPPVVNFGRQQSQLLDQLPFQNEDADLFSFLDGLDETMGQQAASDGQVRADGAESRAGRASALSELPSWLPPALDETADPGSTSAPSASVKSGISQMISVPAPEFPLTAEPLSMPQALHFPGKQALTGPQSSPPTGAQLASMPIAQNMVPFSPFNSTSEPGVWRGNSLQPAVPDIPAGLWSALSQPNGTDMSAAGMQINVPDLLSMLPSLPGGS